MRRPINTSECAPAQNERHWADDEVKHVLARSEQEPERPVQQHSEHPQSDIEDAEHDRCPGYPG